MGQGTITPAYGGTVTEGGLTLTVPANAVAADTQVTITAVGSANCNADAHIVTWRIQTDHVENLAEMGFVNIWVQTQGAKFQMSPVNCPHPDSWADLIKAVSPPGVTGLIACLGPTGTNDGYLLLMTP